MSSWSQYIRPFIHLCRPRAAWIPSCIWSRYDIITVINLPKWHSDTKPRMTYNCYAVIMSFGNGIVWNPIRYHGLPCKQGTPWSLMGFQISCLTYKAYLFIQSHKTITQITCIQYCRVLMHTTYGANTHCVSSLTYKQPSIGYSRFPLR